MIRSIARRAQLLSATFLVLGLTAGPLASQASAATGPLYSGRATVVKGNVLGVAIGPLADTGELESTGGAKEASLLSATVPLPTGGSDALSAEVLHASAIAQGSQSRSEASVASLDLAVAGNTIGADFLMARATAKCTGGQASVSGSSEIVGLTINGQAIAVTGEENQKVDLPVGYVLINEQTKSASGNSGAITVNALHVVIPGVADVVISSAHADIVCGGGCSGKDFVTGGGFILTPSGAKGTFGVAGGIKNGAFWGHLVYIDHGASMRVKGLGVTAYAVTGPTSRHIEGTAEINGQPGSYKVDVADNGEPGRGADTFAIRLSNGYTAAAKLAGGNIQLHQPCS